MAPLVYLNGEFLDPADAQVSLLDRGYLLGDSIFETLRSYGGGVFRMAEHLDRLDRASDVTGIELPKSRTELTGLVRETLSRGQLLDAYIRITISRGEGGPGISPRDCHRPVLSILVRPLVPYPEEVYRRGIATAVVAARRVPAACLDPTIKCGNYLPNILARRELDARGMIEGVQLNVEGHVASGTVSNVFLVRGDRLWTPDLASGCLPGITRAALLEIAPQVGLSPSEQRIEPAELTEADEMFFTNTLMECLPVATIDGHPFSTVPGPYTQSLHDALKALVLQETGNEGTGR